MNSNAMMNPPVALLYDNSMQLSLKHAQFYSLSTFCSYNFAFALLVPSS